MKPLFSNLTTVIGKGKDDISEAKKFKKPKFKFTNEHLADLKEAFEIFDHVGTGLIKPQMLKVAMKALGFEHTTEDIVTLLRPKNYKEMLSFEDFVNIFQTKMSLDPPLHFLMRAFDQYDLEKTKTITTKDIERVSQELGDYLNIEEVLDMVESANDRGDDEINFEEFSKVVKIICAKDIYDEVNDR